MPHNFIDEAAIWIKAGHGGPGMISFRRAKYEPMGGPNGGDGGKGGDVVLHANPNIQTLYDFKTKVRYNAADGDKGGTKECYGRFGDDLLLDLPVGTQIFNEDTGRLICDLAVAGQREVIAKGGVGGKGNTHFKSSTRQSPRFAQPGMPGLELHIRMSLKLLADVGIVGLPNAGKSSLLAALTRAHPKIANYPFTTLYPNLGVAKLKSGRELILADVPGLIEGAHDGLGLGIRFLKHLERTKLLLHMIDISGIENPDPKKSYTVIQNEIKSFGGKLAKLPQIVVLNKIDLIDEERLAAVRAKLPKRIKIVEISAAAKLGLDDLLKKLDAALK